MHDFQSAKFHEICTQDVDLCRDESFWNEILKIFLQGVFFPQKDNFWSKTFNDFGLQAAISPKSLQIAETHDQLGPLRNVDFPFVPLEST